MPDDRLLQELGTELKRHAKQKGVKVDVIDKAIDVATAAALKRGEKIVETFIERAHQYISCHGPAIAAVRIKGSAKRANQRMIEEAEKASLDAVSEALLNGKDDNTALAEGIKAATAVYSRS